MSGLELCFSDIRSDGWIFYETLLIQNNNFDATMTSVTR